MPISEEFCDECFDDIDTNNDGKVNLEELSTYFDSLLTLLITLFEQALDEQPDKLVSHENFKSGQLEQTLEALEHYEANPDELTKQMLEYFKEFDVENKGALDRSQLA